MNYLARLKARSGQKHVPDEPSKLTKPGFVSFDGDLDGHFLQAANASEQPEGGPTMDYLARLKARSEENTYLTNRQNRRNPPKKVSR
jgi:hypothetical protein